MRPEGNDPKNRENNSWVLLQDNSPAHQLVFIKDFLAKNVTVMKHHPFS
jgi:hypothetical protein